MSSFLCLFLAKYTMMESSIFASACAFSATYRGDNMALVYRRLEELPQCQKCLRSSRSASCQYRHTSWNWFVVKFSIILPGERQSESRSYDVIAVLFCRSKHTLRTKRCSSDNNWQLNFVHDRLWGVCKLSIALLVIFWLGLHWLWM